MENKAHAAETILARSLFRSPAKGAQKRVLALADPSGLRSRVSQEALGAPGGGLAPHAPYWPFLAAEGCAGAAYAQNRASLPAPGPGGERLSSWLEQAGGEGTPWLIDRELGLRWPLRGAFPETSSTPPSAPRLDLPALRAEMKESGSVLLPDLLLTPLRDGFRALYTSYIARGLWLYGDKQSPDRFWVNNDWASRLLQLQLLPTVQALAGEKVQPTFATAMRYESGSELTPHKDREQAWLTLTISLECVAGGSPVSWPFYVQHAREGEAEKKYEISPGSGVLFAGEELVHRRDRIPHGGRCLMMCLHFAREAFDGRRK